MENISAGRELDALIAEKVFGLVPCQAEVHEGAYMRPCHANPDSPTSGGETRCYSTNISAAWEVAEKLKITVRPSGGQWWAALMHEHDPGMWIPADTAPLAICLAALTDD